MADEQKKEAEQELMERFDSFVKDTLFDEGNRLRAEKGLSLLTKEDMDEVDTLSVMKEHFAPADQQEK